MRALPLRKNTKLYVLGVAVAATLATTTACDPGGGDNKGGSTASPAARDSSPTTGTPSTPTPDKTDSPSPTAPATTSGGVNTGGGSGGSGGSKKKSGWDYADRQTPPRNSVCAHGGQGPYGKIESVTMGGESPTGVGLVLGMYECSGKRPTFVPTSATGAAMDTFVDTEHLKVVVGGKLASELGTKTPNVNAFLNKLAQMEDKGELKYSKAPEFYFQSDAPGADDALDGSSTHLIYLYQIVDGN